MATGSEKRKKKKTGAPAQSRPGLQPDLDRSTVNNSEGLAKVRPAVAADSNEWKATKV
jgi:hypothetical protein